MLCPHGAKQSSVLIRVSPPTAASVVAVLILACLSTTCTGIARQTSEVPTDPVILRVGFPQLTGQDPLRGMQQASRFLSFEGLVTNSADGSARPRLAESWSVSPDGLRWTFRLRSDAKFHDGSPVDAASVKRSLDESLTSLSDRSQAPGIEDIASIEAVSQRELVIALHNPSTFLLGDLSMAISKQLSGGTRIGTGPFIVKENLTNEIAMSSFDDYYQGAPQVRQIVWKPYPALRTAWAGMMRGEIDFLYEVGQDAVEFVQGESSVNTFSFLRPYVFGVVFNSSRDPLKNQKIRQALNFGVDRQLLLNQALKGHGVVANSPVRPGHWAYDPTVVGYTYDPARAAAILNTFSKVSRRIPIYQGAGGPARFHFTCLLPENFATWERMALFVQKQLFEIGVDMKLEALPSDEFNRRIAQGQFDAAVLEFNGFSMSRPYVYWHSGGALNSFGYSDASVDEALDAIRRARDDAQHRAAVRRLQQAMIADPPAIFLAWGQTARAVSRRFHVTASTDSDILSSVSSWQLAGTNMKGTN